MRTAGRRLRFDASGFTLIEVLVGAVVLASAMLATAQVMIGSVKVNYRSEQSQVAIDRAQAELEAIRTLGFDEVGLTGAPPATPSGGPGDRLTSTCATQGVSTDGCFGLNDDGTNRAPLVVEGGNLEATGSIAGTAVDPGPETFSSGDVSGTIYRYVVWQNDYACPETQCPGLQDRKRVVVVVTLDSTASGGERAYREVQSDFVDPDLGKDIEPVPAPAAETIAQQLFLTDTTCDLAGRIVPSLDHLLHDTTGACSGLAPPDKLSTEPPLLDPLFPAESQPEYDFAIDVEPVIGGDSDKGLQVRRDDSGGCLFDPPGPAAAEKTHRWVTDPIETGSSLVLEGEATLALWTQTVGGVAASGKICVFLFIREEGSGGTTVDTPIGDAGNGGAPFFTYTANPWPAGGWGLASVPMELQPPSGESTVTLLPGQRLGVGITVEAETTADVLQFAYEHTDYDSRLEIETATPLPSGA